ncbi:MAG: hypothetical protein U9R37_06700 [Campylobacterota bacterium]|nr:hypothetical protein [Campylobacterota bacterium]
MIKLIYLLTTTIFIYSGCSSKQYFEPEITKNSNIEVKNINSNIVDYNSVGATLEDRRYISKEGISNEKLKVGFFFVNKSDGKVLSVNDEAILNIDNNPIKFDKNIVSATIDKNILALVFIDNSIVIYDTEINKIIFKEYMKKSLINDVKLTNPIILKTIVLFPTLDGKVTIVDIDKKTISRTINIDPNSDINNIIFLEAIGETLIAATPNKIFSFINGRTKVETLSIKNVVIKDENIYLSTLDGEIIKFDQELKRLNSKKFKFAKFHTIGFGASLYALESEKFLIKLDENLEKDEVYDFYFDEDEKVISIDDKIYFEDKYIILK